MRYCFVAAVFLIAMTLSGCTIGSQEPAPGCYTVLALYLNPDGRETTVVSKSGLLAPEAYTFIVGLSSHDLINLSMDTREICIRNK